MVENIGIIEANGDCGAGTGQNAVLVRRRLPALLLSRGGALAQTAAAGAATVVLDPVDVQGGPRAAGTAYEQATGPVAGFTATESTAGTKTGTPIPATTGS